MANKLNRFIEIILGIPLLGITVFVFSFVGFYFDIPFIILPFTATLFTIYLARKTKYARPKNVIIGHMLGFVGALIAPFLLSYILIPNIFITALSATVAVLIASVLMIVSSTEHPPAAATALLFVTSEQKGMMLFGLYSLQSIVGFAIGLIVVGFVTYLFIKKRYRQEEAVYSEVLNQEE